MLPQSTVARIIASPSGAHCLGWLLSLAFVASATGGSLAGAPTPEPLELLEPPLQRGNASDSGLAGSLAVLSVGLARTVAHPAVVVSFGLMLAPLLRSRSVVRTFMFLTPPQAVWEAEAGVWQTRIRRLYRPTELWIMDAELPCNVQCGSVPCNSGPNMPFEFLRQFFKVKLAWELVLTWESKHAWRFDWFLKVRPDLLWLEPFPLLPALTAAGHVNDAQEAEVYVPKGVMTDRRANYHVNDHVLLCPRQLCMPYFTDAISRYERCSEVALKPVYPIQRWLFNRTCPRGSQCFKSTTLFDVAYTIARAKGPECMRLYTAGYLWQFVPRCNAVASRWSDPKYKEHSHPRPWLALMRTPTGTDLREMARRLKSRAP